MASPTTNPTTFALLAPPWSLASLDANFLALDSAISSANNYSNYLVDVGVANGYSVSFSVLITMTLSAGLEVQIKALHTNTGASTLTVSGTAATPIVNPDGSALAAGQIIAGGIFSVLFDGTNYQLLGGGGTGGSVSTVSITSANGFAGTVLNPHTTPAITLTTSITGILKGNATAISAASSGTDYAPGTSGLATGMVKSTTGTGALSIGSVGLDYLAPISDKNFVMSTSTGNAYTITLPVDTAYTAFVAGDRFTWRPDASNTGASTLTIISGVHTVGPLAIKRNSVTFGWDDVWPGDLTISTTVTVVYDGNYFVIVSDLSPWYVRMGSVNDRQYTSARRINLSNTGSYGSGGTFPAATEVAYSADAHRFYRDNASWNSTGNDASFVFQTDVTAVGPNYGPVHGGVWSVLYMAGGPSAGFAAVASGHRGHSGVLYGMHSEVFDANAAAGVNVVFNAEANPFSGTNAATEFIMYNAQPAGTISGVIGLQLQSISSLATNYASGICLSNWYGGFFLDASTATFGTSLMSLPLGVVSATVTNGGGVATPANVGGFIKVTINGTPCRVPYFPA
jgi:hypothetical protein